jgi:hypothetical protein
MYSSRFVQVQQSLSWLHAEFNGHLPTLTQSKFCKRKPELQTQYVTEFTVLGDAFYGQATLEQLLVTPFHLKPSLQLQTVFSLFGDALAGHS